MVSGFLISPYDHDRIFSGDAIEIRIWSKTCAGACGLKRFMISWFIVFSSISGGAQPRGSSNCPPDGALAAPQPLDSYSAASAPGACLELYRSTLRPSERISL